MEKTLEKNTEQQARQQIGVLEDVIDIRAIDQLSGIGAHFSTILIRAMESTESLEIMRKIIDEQTLMYPRLQEEMNAEEQEILSRTLSGSWEDVLLHAQICQRLLDQNI